jgi:hypothetical protein
VVSYFTESPVVTAVNVLDIVKVLVAKRLDEQERNSPFRGLPGTASAGVPGKRKAGRPKKTDSTEATPA